MIPVNVNNNEVTLVQYPSKEYKLHLENEIIYDNLDGVESVKQAIYKILMTKRYKNLIYNFDYGVELSDLYGKPVTSIFSTIEERVKDALSIDDRIHECKEFKFKLPKRGEVLCYFTSVTTVGNIENEVMFNV